MNTRSLAKIRSWPSEREMVAVSIVTLMYSECLMGEPKMVAGAAVEGGEADGSVGLMFGVVFCVVIGVVTGVVTGVVRRVLLGHLGVVLVGCGMAGVVGV